MAISDTLGDGWDLSASAQHLYEACAARDAGQVSQITAANPEAQDELLAWGLITLEDQPGGVPGVRDPRHALQRRTEEVLAAAEKQVALLRNLPSLSSRLMHHYEAVQLRAGSGSIYLDDPAAVNTRLQDVVGAARREILAAQPGGPRDRVVLGKALARDAVALDRGVELRTIYRDTVRDHPVTAEHARKMANRGAGRSAQYRTLAGAFERMIIVDREQAFVSDHIVAGGPAHAAWLITDPAAVAVMAKMFDVTWMGGRPWSGELRARRGGNARDTIGSTSVQGARTTRHQREILRNLSSGVSQKSAARRVGVSFRKLSEEIAGLKALWGVTTLNELVYQWALSPDHQVDDSAPAGLAGGAKEQESAA